MCSVIMLLVFVTVSSERAEKLSDTNDGIIASHLAGSSSQQLAAVVEKRTADNKIQIRRHAKRTVGVEVHP